MITQLASPSVCVIDDEREEYEPILAALNGLFVSSIHILDKVEELPEQPFKRLRLIFIDLHLSGTVGKDAASYTANVFTKVVSEDTSPIVVVIWSKYAGDKISEPGVPPEDQETEADLFKRTLIGAVPKFRGRLIFVELAKPKKDDRPQEWTEKLKAEIERALKNQSAVELVWAWNSMVEDACAAVSSSLTSVAAEHSGAELKDSLKSILQRLTRSQGENDLSETTAPRHLVTVLGQLLVDQLEHSDTARLAGHGKWLAAPAASAGSDFASRMNGTLLTAVAPTDGEPFAPGTLYRLKNADVFPSAFGSDVECLVDLLLDEGQKSKKLAEWRTAVRPVVIEVSPACDVAQGNRANALLVAGLVVPATRQKLIKKGDSFFRGCQFSDIGSRLTTSRNRTSCSYSAIGTRPPCLPSLCRTG
jgi:hypothetical protein